MLRPLQVAYESPKFMLPIRLGMVNADGPQELFVYALTRKGRVETTNYRTVKLPTGMDVPLYVKERLPRFLQGDVRAAGEEGEHARGLHRVRLGHGLVRSVRGRSALERRAAAARRLLVDDQATEAAWQIGRRPIPAGPQNVFITRLHVRYDAAHFPEDLVFQETADRENFQGRYVLRHPWTGERLVRGGRPLSRATAAAARARSADPGVADRLGHQRDPSIHERRHPPPEPASGGSASGSRRTAESSAPRGTLRGQVTRFLVRHDRENVLIVRLAAPPSAATDVPDAQPRTHHESVVRTSLRLQRPPRVWSRLQPAQSGRVLHAEGHKLWPCRLPHEFRR